jgi:methyl-accepting chemotaxis protein
MRRKVSLNFKIGSVVAVMAIGSGVISWIGISKLSVLQASLTELVDVQGEDVKAVYKIQRDFAGIVRNEMNFLLDDNSKDKEERETRIVSFDKAVQDGISTVESKALPEDKKDIDEMKDAYAVYMANSKNVLKLAKEGKLKEATDLSQVQGRDHRRAFESESQDLLDKSEKRMSEARNNGAILYFHARNILILTTLLSLGLGIFLAVMTMRAIGKSVSHAIGALTDSSNQLNAAAQSLAATSTQISQASTEQASVVQETASSIEEMSSMVGKNSENARKASEVSEQSHKTAVRGKEVVNKMIHSIQEIDSSNANIMEQIGKSNEQLSEIVRVIVEIGNKTKVINDIVFQTKLLSFNASVEAARAGEHGKGFAVVAEEVGNLAQMSGNAAREITDMLDGSIRKVEEIVQETKTRVESLVGDNRAKVSEGVQVANECGGVLEEIVGSISGVTEMAANISSASQEQAHGVREITQAMNQLDEVTQQNAAASEQAANAASQLTNQAGSLKSVVSSLAESIYGNVRGDTPVSKVAKQPQPKKMTAAVETREVTMAKKAEVIPLPVKSKVPEKKHEAPPTAKFAKEPSVKLKTAGTGGLASLPSPDDERFKDI